MRRRGFLASAAVLGAAPLLTKCRAHDAAASKAPADLSDWEQVRRQFSLDPAWVHMSMFFLASHPAPVKEAIEAHRRGLDENPYNYTEENIGRLERATRAAAGEYFSCQPDDLAMTDSTTMGLGTFYGGLALREGQEILSTTHDHPATNRALDYRAARSGAAVRRIPLYGKASETSPEQMADELARAITPRTRVIAVTWVHSSTGVKTPLPLFAQVVAAANRGRAEPDRGIAGRRRVHRRLPQVDLRASRDRADLGERGRMGGDEADHPDLRRDVAGRNPGPHAEGRADDAGRLPLFRVSLGARAGLPLPPRHRQSAGRPANPRPERSVQARPFADAARAAAHAAVRRRVGGHHLLRGGRRRSRSGRGATQAAQGHRQRHAQILRGELRSALSQSPHFARGRGSGAAGRPRDRLSAAPLRSQPGPA